MECSNWSFKKAFLYFGIKTLAQSTRRKLRIQSPQSNRRVLRHRLTLHVSSTLYTFKQTIRQQSKWQLLRFIKLDMYNRPVLGGKSWQ